MDDFKGWFCNLGSFPIIEAVKEEFEHKITLITEENQDESTFSIYTTDLIKNNIKDLKSTKKHNANSSTKKILNYKSTTKQIKDSEKNDISYLNEENGQKIYNSLKKFKAVREVKLITCLDQLKCSNNVSYIVFSNYVIIFINSIFLNIVFNRFFY